MLTLEMCKKLKDARFRQDTELYYRGYDQQIFVGNTEFGDKYRLCAYPTADEIWAELTVEQKKDFIIFIESEMLATLSLETALAEYWLEVNYDPHH